jgi:hypothetical protein
MFFSGEESQACWPCCETENPPFVTHYKLTGGADGGTLVWRADRGGINGLPPLRNQWQFGHCWKIRIDGTQVYTGGPQVIDTFYRGGGDPRSYFKSIYTLQDPLVGFPATFTIYEDASAGGSFQIGVVSRDTSGAVIGSGQTFAVPFDADATTILNAINACPDGFLGSGATFVTPGDYTVTGGPLPGTPIVITPSGRLAGTASGAGAAGGQITSDYRNSCEAWDKDGNLVWSTSLNGNCTNILVSDTDLMVSHTPYNYLQPAYYVDGNGAASSSRTLKCWDGDPPSPIPNTALHPQPVGGYFLMRLIWNDGSTIDQSLTATPIPFDVSAADLQTALRALPSAAHGTGLITCSGGPMPGTNISITLPTLPSGQSWQLCSSADTLIGPFDSYVTLRRLSTVDGTDQNSNSAWGLYLWFQLSSVGCIAKRGDVIYVTGNQAGAVPADSGGVGSTFPGCDADPHVSTRTYDTSLNPTGDLNGRIGIDPSNVSLVTSICFDSSGNCYSACTGTPPAGGNNDVLWRIGSDFQTGGFHFAGTSAPAGAAAMLSDSVVVGTWSNRIGLFSTADGSKILDAEFPDTEAVDPSGLALGVEVCCDSNSLIYVAVRSRGIDTPEPGCVICYDSSLDVQWQFDHVSEDGTVLGAALTVCCEPDGSYVYFGGSRIPVVGPEH